MGWTPTSLGDQSEKTFVITGGNSGLGLEAARILTAKGAAVVVTTRSAEKGEGAVEAVKAAVPDAKVSFVQLDLADLDSVQAAAKEILDAHDRLDAVINNAGVMQTPELRTKQGFELQFGTNHLGHFRFNALLFPLLEQSKARIVAVSSIAHKFGAIDLDDLNFERRRYDATAAYGQSKLANLMYALELQRRLAARSSTVTAYAAHPGYAATNLQSAGVGLEGGSGFLRGLYKITNKVMAQTAAEGAYPLVLAAASTDAKPGAYYGPTKMMDTRGAVGESRIKSRAHDEAIAAKLWDESESLVGTFFPSE